MGDHEKSQRESFSEMPGSMFLVCMCVRGRQGESSLRGYTFLYSGNSILSENEVGLVKFE